MENKSPFLGIKKPLHTALIKEQVLEYLLPEKEQLNTAVQALYQLPVRECHYAAIELFDKLKTQLRPNILTLLRKLIEFHSWWDSADAISSGLAGPIVLLKRKITFPLNAQVVASRQHMDQPGNHIAPIEVPAANRYRNAQIHHPTPCGIP